MHAASYPPPYVPQYIGMKKGIINVKFNFHYQSKHYTHSQNAIFKGSYDSNRIFDIFLRTRIRIEF